MRAGLGWLLNQLVMCDNGLGAREGRSETLCEGVVEVIDIPYVHILVYGVGTEYQGRYPSLRVGG